LLGMSLLLALLGVAWLWVATRVPHTLLPGTRRALLAATRRHRVSTDAASRLLAELRAAAPADEAWARFEDETGLHLPRFARWVIDPAMDPAALVRYLSARQLQGAAAPQSLTRVTVVPVILCLVPAAVLLLLV
jgi:hypothetical protein